MGDLGLDLPFLGIIIGIAGISLTISGLFWRSVSEKHGGRTVLQLAAMLKLIPPLLLLAIVYLIDTTYYADEVSGTTLVNILIGVAFASLAIASTSANVGTFRYLADVMPVGSGTTPHRATNMILGLSSGMAILGGLGAPGVGLSPTLWSRSSVKHCWNPQQRPTPGSTKNRETDPRFPQSIPSRVFASSPIESPA